jgi:outer membrane protein OmpA-like peptidoglycan-associated protein
VKPFLLSLLICPFLLNAQINFDSLILTATHPVYFDFGKADIRPSMDTLIRYAVDVAGNLEGVVWQLKAHTDSIGSLKANQQLSERRGRAIQRSLVDLGVDAASVKMVPFGEQKPLAANRTEEGRQLNRRVDIEMYRPVRMTWLKGQIRDEDTDKGIQADIVIHSKIYRDSFQTLPNGTFEVPVPDNTVVGIDIYAKDHFFITKMLKVNSLKPIPVDIQLPPAKVGYSIDIENIFFVGNQDTLLERSKPELPKLLRFMQLNPGLRIEIAGHVNVPNAPPIETNSWSFRLSEKRAKRVYDYLVEQGVDSTRLTYRGYGNWQMKFPNARSEYDQERNRRVEIKILEQLPPTNR